MRPGTTGRKAHARGAVGALDRVLDQLAGADGDDVDAAECLRRAETALRELESAAFHLRAMREDSERDVAQRDERKGRRRRSKTEQKEFP